MKCIKVLAGVFPLTLGLFLCPMVHAQTQRTATAIATVGGGSVTDITLTDGGSGYPPELSKVDISTEIVKITGGNGKGAKARAFMNPGSDDGRIVSIQILEYGTGYTQPTIVQIESPSEVLARFQVPKIDPEKERREHAQ